MPAQKFT